MHLPFAITATDCLVWGGLFHLVADWLFQNDWMAQKKVILGHPAGLIHAGIHFVAQLPVFPWYIALQIAVIHYVIDLRFILKAWRRFFVQDTGPLKDHVAIWEDQVLHIVVIAAYAVLCGK